MYSYNLTINVQPAVHEQWYDWVRTDFVPEMLATDAFVGYQLNRVISLGESNGRTYSLQFFCRDMKGVHQFQIKHGTRLQRLHSQRFGDQIVEFQSLMQIVDQQMHHSLDNPTFSDS